MNVPVKTRELAYTTWRQCGQNLSETMRILNNQHGCAISRQALTEWKQKYDWEGRAARTEAEEKERAEATSDDALLLVLLKQKKKYEDYFDTLPAGTVDNQAIYAYNNILKTLLDIREKIHGDHIAGIDRPKLFLEALEFITNILKETDPEGLKILARNFDTIIETFKNHETKK